MLLNINEFSEKSLKKFCIFPMGENEINFKHVLRHEVRHLQCCYIFSVAWAVFLEMVPFCSHVFNSHEPYPNRGVQNKPFPNSGPPFSLLH
jgi:hypothetical protein